MAMAKEWLLWLTLSAIVAAWHSGTYISIPLGSLANMTNGTINSSNVYPFATALLCFNAV